MVGVYGTRRRNLSRKVYPLRQKLEFAIRFMRVVGNISDSRRFSNEVFYAGVTLYELFTDTRLRLGNNEIRSCLYEAEGVPVKPPHEVKWEIPQSISHIIMKMLGNSPEEMYRSAQAVEWELKEYRVYMDRKDSLSIIRGDYSQVKRSRRAFVRFIHGDWGSGKSPLVPVIRTEFFKNDCFFGIGRYTRRHPQTASFGLHQALRDLLQQFLSLPPAEFAVCGKELVDSLGAKAALFTSLFPEARHIFRNVENQGDTIVGDAETKITAVMGTFLEVLARNRNVVIFLDGLHWSDNISRRLLPRILAGFSGAVLVIATSISSSGEEVTSPGPELKSLGIPQAEIELEPIENASIPNYIEVLVSGYLQRLGGASLC